MPFAEFAPLLESAEAKAPPGHKHELCRATLDYWATSVEAPAAAPRSVDADRLKLLTLIRVIKAFTGLVPGLQGECCVRSSESKRCGCNRLRCT